MKYLTITETGFELRSDISIELPINSIELTDSEYQGLLNETLQLINGVIVPI
jgi:hypothetical protein